MREPFKRLGRGLKAACSAGLGWLTGEPLKKLGRGLKTAWSAGLGWLSARPRPGPGFWRRAAVLGGLSAAALGFSALAGWVAGAPVSQQAARRWSDGLDEARSAQISYFLADSAAMPYMQILELRDSLDTKLRESSLEARGPNARLWIDAFSVTRSYTVSAGGRSQQAEVTGIGGDYFYFHPAELIFGQLISGSDLLKDVVVIDETLAWRLYGAFNVVGFEIDLGGRICYVGGVVRAGGRWPESLTYGESGRAYAAFEVLEQIDSGVGATCYEMVLPDPVSGFALGLAEQAAPADESRRMLVENSARFGAGQLLAKLKNFSRIGMQTQAIALPYWENAARAAENYALLLIALALMSAAGPAACLAIWLVRVWRKRGALWRWILGEIRRRQTARWHIRAGRKDQNRVIAAGQAENTDAIKEEVGL